MAKPSSSKLLGPPELHPPQVYGPAENPNKSTGDPFMDLMLAEFNKPTIPKPPKGFTENLSATYMSSGNPCLDFFFHIVPNTPASSLDGRLDAAWKHDPLSTLKLICHLRGVRNTGKSDKQGFYTAALWLHKYHPKTLACNLKYMVDFGYFKDLPEILYRLLHGPEVRKTGHVRKSSRKQQKNLVATLSHRRAVPNKFIKQRRVKKSKEQRRKEENLSATRQATREKRLQAESLRAKVVVEKARKKRKEKKVDMAKKAVERYARDPDYRFLHDCVSEVFAERLVSDVQALKCGEVQKIGLASKWCPSLGSSFDRAILLCESIARRVFPRDSYPEYEGVEEAHYAYRVRDRLRKEVLVPLRQALELPEIYMSLNEWNNLPYNRVASLAMTNYKEHFQKHDEERFTEYLGKVKSGEAKIAAGALLPHDIIKEAVTSDMGEVAELQWKRMVDDLSQKGKLRNCIAVCDVSASMRGTPMDVCVALGLLISELSEEPWKDNVMTFHGNPQLHKVQGDDLKTKTEFIKQMEWGGNTDFQKVFDRILDVASNGKLSKEQMIQKIFVFSDMEFDQAYNPYDQAYNLYGYHGYGYGYNPNPTHNNKRGWDTDYEVIQKKYSERGYEVPQIIFWNLRNSKATPVTADQKGVAMVSGFSKNMVKLFLEEDDDLMLLGPEHVMNMAIAGPEFSKLVVLD